MTEDFDMDALIICLSRFKEARKALSHVHDIFILVFGHNPVRDSEVSIIRSLQQTESAIARIQDQLVRLIGERSLKENMSNGPVSD